MTIEIIDFVEEPKANIYDEDVKALIAAGEGKAITLTIPLADKLKARNAFAIAANNNGHTARVKVSEASGTTAWRYVFTLATKNAPRRNKAREDEYKATASGHVYEANTGQGDSVKEACAICGVTERFHTLKPLPMPETVTIDGTVVAITERHDIAGDEGTPESTPESTPKPRNTRKR